MQMLAALHLGRGQCSTIVLLLLCTVPCAAAQQALPCGGKGLSWDIPLCSDATSAPGGLLRMARWADAVGALLRFAMSCDAAGAANAQCKCYLSAVIVWLHAGSAAQAWATYQVALHRSCDGRVSYAGCRQASLRTARLGTHAGECSATVSCKSEQA